MSDHWYVLGADKKPEGPYASHEVQSKLTGGEVTAATPVNRAGTTEWKPISTTKLFTPPAGPQSRSQDHPGVARSTVGGGVGVLLVTLGGFGVVLGVVVAIVIVSERSSNTEVSASALPTTPTAVRTTAQPASAAASTKDDTANKQRRSERATEALAEFKKNRARIKADTPKVKILLRQRKLSKAIHLLCDLQAIVDPVVLTMRHDELPLDVREVDSDLEALADEIGSLEEKVIPAAWRILYKPDNSSVDEEILFAQAGKPYRLSGAEVHAAYNRRPDIVEPLHKKTASRPEMCEEIKTWSAEK